MILWNAVEVKVLVFQADESVQCAGHLPGWVTLFRSIIRNISVDWLPHTKLEAGFVDILHQNIWLEHAVWYRYRYDHSTIRLSSDLANQMINWGNLGSWSYMNIVRSICASDFKTCLVLNYERYLYLNVSLNWNYCLKLAFRCVYSQTLSRVKH